MTHIYRYSFRDSVLMEDVVATLDLSFLAATSLHGETNVLMNCRYAHSRDRRFVVIDARSHEGHHLNQLFCGFCRSEFGVRAFTVKRVTDSNEHGLVDRMLTPNAELRTIEPTTHGTAFPSNVSA